MSGVTSSGLGITNGGIDGSFFSCSGTDMFGNDEVGASKGEGNRCDPDLILPVFRGPLSAGLDESRSGNVESRSGAFEPWIPESLEPKGEGKRCCASLSDLPTLSSKSAMQSPVTHLHISRCFQDRTGTEPCECVNLHYLDPAERI